MTRKIIYSDLNNYQNHKISEFLRSQGYSKQLLTSLRHQNGSIYYGDNEVHMNHLIQSDSQKALTVFIPELEKPSTIVPVDYFNNSSLLKVNILYEDEDLFVVNKPSGMPIQPSKSNPDNSLGNAMAYLYATRKEPFVYRCVNRLDRDTSGLTILAKNPLSAGILYEMVKSRKVDRTYFAIVSDPICSLPSEGTIDFPISREEATDQLHSIRRFVDYENGATAITHFKKLHSKNGLSLVELHLETGRTHQIRVHMSALGYPLIGDFLYHSENHQMERQALHAGALSFSHPITGEHMHFEVPLPDDMAHFFNK